MIETWFRRWVTIFLCICTFTGHAQSVALTFDDGFDPRVDAAAAQSNAQLLKGLHVAGIRSMLFPAGSMVDSDPGKALVRAWSDAGHLLGNHSYSHRALSTPGLSATVFFDDILRAQEMFEAFPGWCAGLRFPYLDEGSHDESKAEALLWMSRHGYGVAAATISIDDWTYDQRYVAEMRQKSGNDDGILQKLYLDRLWQEAQRQDAAWTQRLGRAPMHVLLLHANTLNAAVLPDLVSMFRSHGWTFVDPRLAFSDPIYSRGYVLDGQAQVLPGPRCR